ncbi:hypothetical protein CONPUDRAFT_162259 [Coniophora puteana RWD-64-598 SS2]|uniref:Zn(2)-C6 fungal-type domain-containing protein n=1 Tax=Coniophora puteana (strain RWD-64-598) TaxID=741705 RepID=A0A5M3N1Z9_CONPW|nr:uncharacterized protein CONPUDRAFT_162259 [Coniophora puteana RWD-64-598 SS2]EIW84945.1 hypothetical protein CONPUDRAFT_162259 [Coniophora puteana RWD-64-598 SS2]
MESSVRDPKSSDPQSEPPEPSASPPPSRKPRSKKAGETTTSRAAAETPRRRSQATNSDPRSAQLDSTSPSHYSDAARAQLPRAPLFPAYPSPFPYIMNPNYPLNPSPFTQHQQHLSSPYGASGSTGSTGGQQPPMTGHPGYYPMHAAPYPPPAPHGYAPYSPYSQMMMYSHPRPNSGVQEHHEQAAHATPTPSPVQQAPPLASQGSKRKRKGDGGRSKDTDRESDPEGTDTGGKSTTPTTSAPTASEMSKKRTKTQRACDSCRSRKIRCDVLADTEPPLCQHCKQYGFECTFFLPITETRFKKKKLEDEAAEKEKSAELRRRTSSPSNDPQNSDRRVFGPTTAVHLLHSQATINSRIYENYDQRYHHTWEVSNDGDGVISVSNKPVEDKQVPHPKHTDIRIEKDVVEKLVNVYFQEIAPMLPVITKEEFLGSSSPSPVLLYSICLVAATRREVPQTVFDSIRFIVNNIIKADDVLSTASIANVQALLILSMAGDSHSQFVPNALSALWVRLGTAIRMAQDLGLHRAESVKQNIDVRRRLWGVCVICDRWLSLTYGHPYMIDVQDCDARLPTSGEAGDLYMNELVRLSVILGRVLKTIYSPSGLMFATDEHLITLLADLESWKANLPLNLQYKGPDTPRDAGLLHLFYSCVCMIFWRVFMRISYSCPAHLKFGLTVENWSNLVLLTGEAIDWLDKHENVYDSWLLVAYAATSCALVQYHTWARRQDNEAAEKLCKLRDCIRRWESSISPDHMSARRKTAEIIALLYEATQGPPLPLDKPPLNPTGGVKGKPPPMGSLQYKKDPSRPGGGVFVAHGDAAKDGAYEDMLQGTIITSSDDELDGAQAEQPGSPQRNTSMVTITPLPGAGGRSDITANMNPSLNNPLGQTQGNVQVLNVLDVPQASNTLQQFAMADVGLLEGIPGGMFDWGQWDSFFSRFNNSEGGNPGLEKRDTQQGPSGNTAGSPQQQQQQQQQVSPQGS